MAHPGASESQLIAALCSRSLQQHRLANKSIALACVQDAAEILLFVTNKTPGELKSTRQKVVTNQETWLLFQFKVMTSVSVHSCIKQLDHLACRQLARQHKTLLTS